jgi:Tol biopolymer transport system component
MVLGIAAFASLAVPAAAALPGRNGKIAFVGKGNQIYVVSPAGEHLRRLTHTDSEKSSPAFSPDGRRIVFADLSLDPSRETHFQISIMDADGRHRHQLTHGGLDNTSPSFSPSGKRLAFARAGSIYLMRTDGSRRRLVTERGHSPAFSPNGRRIVFEGSDTKPGDAGTPRERSGIVIVDVDGQRRRELTRSPMSSPDPLGVSFPTHIDHDPSFSPDGRRILFVRSPPSCLTGDLYLMTANGRHVHAITRPHDGCGDFYEAAFSPDGHWIVADGLRLMRSDGTHRRRLAEAKGESPDWQAVLG